MLVGVDPGVGGALALLREDGRLMAVVDMPSVSVRVGKTQRTRINAAALAAVVREWAPDHAAVERVAPRTTDTPMTAGYLCEAMGTVVGVLAALGVPVTMAETQGWRKASDIRTHPGMTYRDRKEASRKRALELWPMQAAWFARKKDSDRSEAALVARWLLLKGMA